MSKTKWLAVASIGLILTSGLAFAGEITREAHEVTLRATGEPARMHNPPCATGEITGAGEVRAKIKSSIDSYIGLPILQGLSSLSPDVNNWINERFGLNDGRSSCATLCVVVPNGVAVYACMHQEPFDGSPYPDACQVGNGTSALQYSSIEGYSDARGEDGINVVCATGKNWSHDHDRKFSLRAKW